MWLNPQPWRTHSNSPTNSNLIISPSPELNRSSRFRLELSERHGAVREGVNLTSEIASEIEWETVFYWGFTLRSHSVSTFLKKSLLSARESRAFPTAHLVSKNYSVPGSRWAVPLTACWAGRYFSNALRKRSQVFSEFPESYKPADSLVGGLVRVPRQERSHSATLGQQEVKLGGCDPRQGLLCLLAQGQGAVWMLEVCALLYLAHCGVEQRDNMRRKGKEKSWCRKSQFYSWCRIAKLDLDNLDLVAISKSNGNTVEIMLGKF